MRRFGPPGRMLAIGLLAGIASFGHVLYPAWLAIKTRGRPDPQPPTPDAWPGMTVLVPAYRESAVIAAKVDDTLGNGYPGPLEVLVVADDEQTAAAARETPAAVETDGQRLGKAHALNRGVSRATHDLVVLTDANASLAPGALSALARWFEDESVGAVAGEKRVLDESESVYWRFESWLKRRESRLGTTIGLVGEIAAVRRPAYRPLPTDLLVDDLWLALDVISGGHRIVYEPDAVAEEHGAVSLAEEWERRTRRVAGALDVVWQRRDLLRPGRGPAAAQLWGHRVVRLSAGPVAHVVLLGMAVANARRSRVAALFCLGHALGTVAVVRKHRGARIAMPERALAQVLFLQAVALRGTVRWLTTDRTGAWEKGDRQASFPSNGKPRA